MKLIFLSLFLLLHTTSICAQVWKTDVHILDSLIQNRYFGKATSLCEEILPQIEKDSTRKSAAFLKVRNSFGQASIYVSDSAKSSALLYENVALCKDFAPKSEIYAHALNNLGLFFVPIYKGKQAKLAETFLKEALAIRTEIFSKKGVEYTSSLKALGMLYYETADYKNSEVYYDEYLISKKKTFGEKHLEYADALTSLARLYKKLGLYENAKKYYLEASNIYKESLGEKHTTYSSNLFNLATSYKDMGYFTIAEPLYKESLRLKKELVGRKHPDYALIVNGLANLYRQMGCYLLAEQQYKESLAIYKEIFGEKHINYAGLLNNLGIVATMNEHYAEAETLLKKAAAIQKEILGTEHPDYAQTIGNLANIYSAVGHFSKAEAFLKEDIRIKKSVLGNQHEQYARSLLSLALFYMDTQNYQLAQTLFEEALQILKASLGEKHPDYVYTLQGFARLNWLKGNKDVSFKEQTSIKNWVLEQISLQFPYLSELQREGFYNEVLLRKISVYGSYAIARPEIDTEALYDLQLATKAVLMQATQKIRNRILNSGDSALIKKYAEWNSIKEKIIRASQMTQEERKQKSIEMESLQSLNEDLEKELSLKSEAFATLTDKKQTSWKDIQKTLKKNEAAIEIVRFNKFGVHDSITDTSDVAKAPNFPKYYIYYLSDTIYYAALIVKKNSKKPEIILLKNGKELEKDFAIYQKNAIQFLQKDSLSYAQFWQPIASNLKGIKKVYFSPDGIYNQISLNTLQNPKTKKFVLDEIELHLVTNTKDILAFGKSENKTLKAELLGYPLYDLQTQNADAARMREILADSTRAFANFQQVSLLPGTKKEVETIYEILNKKNYQTKVLMEKNATEENIKKIKNPKVLHLSTHGFFIDSKEKNEKVNPMLRSGLLLTGVSDYTRAEMKPDVEDGILTALEAANLDLDETDLVVLSACETGLGDVKAGEGVYGLQRAFKVAGAKSIVMSMWKVDDAVTQKLMTTFYQKFAESNKARQAFKEAQAIIKKQHPEPYYWGAFVMVGE